MDAPAFTGADDRAFDADPEPTWGPPEDWEAHMDAMDQALYVEALKQMERETQTAPHPATDAELEEWFEARVAICDALAKAVSAQRAA